MMDLLSVLMGSRFIIAILPRFRRLLPDCRRLCADEMRSTRRLPKDLLERSLEPDARRSKLQVNSLFLESNNQYRRALT